MSELIITPKTKVYDLLEAYPRLEDVLIAMVPQFRKLKNPILRNTVARITSLGQAASIGGIAVEEIVSRLRAEVGQSAPEDLESEQGSYRTEKPDWFEGATVAETIDVRKILDAGEEPVHEVLSAIRKLKEKEVLMIIAPFLPAPLIDKSLSMGCDHWIDERSEQEYRVYFTAPGR